MPYESPSTTTENRLEYSTSICLTRLYGKRKLTMPTPHEYFVEDSLSTPSSQLNYFEPMKRNLYKDRIYEGHKEATNLQEVLRLVGDPEAIRNEVFEDII